jgi:hypothetical protein
MYLFLAVNSLVIGTILYLIINQNIQNLRNNWSLYRCNPLYMAFAGWVDPADGVDGNFRKCMNLYGKDLVGGMTDIFGAQLSLIMVMASNTSSTRRHRLNTMTVAHHMGMRTSPK